MSLTSDEIADKEFLVGLRGYDKEEVRTFLRTVSKEFAASDQSAPHANGGPAPAEPAPLQPSTQPDWSSLGADIAAVLRTAHEQADALRSEAGRVLLSHADANVLSLPVESVAAIPSESLLAIAACFSFTSACVRP